jgi:ubiquitin-protein ligase E3 C
MPALPSNPPGVLVDAPFAGFFLGKLLGRAATLNDLPSLDAQLARSLATVLAMPPGDVESLGLTFSVDDDIFGATRTVWLRGRPEDAETAVTGANVKEYALLVAHHKLNVAVRAQSRAFVQGFHDVLPKDFIPMFPRVSELRLLIQGTREFDVQDLRAHTVYQGGYGDDGEDGIIEWFWDIFANFPDDDRRALLRFVTSVDRAPLGGFQHMNPKFCIARGGATDRLPSASTCFHLLKLPCYESREALEDKLVQSIRAGAGFELS